jgi:hypothetical protein
MEIRGSLGFGHGSMAMELGEKKWLKIILVCEGSGNCLLGRHSSGLFEIFTPYQNMEVMPRFDM